MGSSASATYDWSNRTMNIYNPDGLLLREETEEIANKTADAIFSTCNTIEVLQFEFKGFNGYLIRNRP